MIKYYLVRFSGEIVLKSERTRASFERRLVRNIVDMTRKKNVKNIKITRGQARLFIEGPEELEDILKRVFGIYSFSPIKHVIFEKLDDLAEKVEREFKDLVIGRTFAVRVKRAGKHQFTSMDAARIIGARLYKYSKGVDLKNPEVEVFVEIRDQNAYLYNRIIPGPGGLPIGVNGKAISLFSGGFDSPVASWFAWKRGVALDFVYFNLGGVDAVYRAMRVLKVLVENWCSGYSPKVHIVDFRPLVAQIMKKVKSPLKQVILRRFMYRAAQSIAEEVKASALVTGESLGQVSSQTLWNLTVEEEILKMPVLRPLIGFDKQEIMDLARKIGTYEESSKVREYCAIVRGRAATRARLEEVKKEEEKISPDLIIKVVNEREIYEVYKIKPVDFLPRENVVINFIPDEAILVDVRSRKEYNAWHPENAVYIEDIALDSIPKEKVIILYCESGEISFELAKDLREKGFRVYSFEGGIPQLKKRFCS